MVNLVKHFTIVIYDSRVVSLENCPYYNSRVVIYARKMFMVKWPLVIDKVRPCVGFRIWRQCVALLCWNQVLLLVVSSHVASFNQSECFIKAKRSYTTLKFIYDIGPFKQTRLGPSCIFECLIRQQKLETIVWFWNVVCGTSWRMVVSDFKDPRLGSSHRPFHLLSTVLNRWKRSRERPILKTIKILVSLFTWIAKSNWVRD